MIYIYMEEFQNNERNELKHDFEFIDPEDFEELNIGEIPPYEGGGATSFSSKYDKEKIEYLKNIGVDVPEEWIDDNGEIIENCRPLATTMFIVTGHILAMEKARRLIEVEPDYKERFMQLVNGSNAFLLENRLDTSGRRMKVLDGVLFEDIKRDLGFSANPEQRVSKEELHDIVKHIFDCLKSKEEE